MALQLLKRLDARFLGIAVLSAIAIGIATCFVLSERTIYISDLAHYQRMAIELVLAFKQSPLEAITMVSRSLSREYNQVYALPLLPFFLLGGESRLTYVLGLTLVYLVPLSLVLGAIATYLIQAPARLVFWSTALITLLIPTLWITLLRGYPDVGGALLIALAALLYLQDLDLKRVKQAVQVGLLLALAIIFRRHFAYDVLAFLQAALGLGVMTVAGLWRYDRPRAGAYLFRYLRGLGIVTALVPLTLVVVSWKWVYTTLTTDYKTLYAGYATTTSEVAWSYLHNYGWILSLLVLVGYTAGLARPLGNRRAIGFFALWSIFWLGQWCFSVRYLGPHYTLGFTPKAILGLSLAVWFIGLAWPLALRLISLTGFCLFLGLNAGICLSTAGLSLTWQPWFSGNQPPIIRSDYPEMVRLMAYLRQIATPAEPILILSGAHWTLSTDFIFRAETQLYGHSDRKLQDVPVPTVDSSGWYPLQELLRAKYVLLPIPYTQDLPAGEQDILQIPHTVFTQNQEFAQDFKLLPEQFAIGHSGSQVRIYQRQRPTSSATAIRLLHQMQLGVGDRPGNQQDWMLLERSTEGIGLVGSEQNAFQFKLLASQPAPVAKTAFLYLGKLTTHDRLTGELVAQPEDCAAVSLRTSLVNQQGEILQTRDTNYSAPRPTNLTIPLRSAQAPTYLLVEAVSSVQPTPAVPTCQLRLNRVRVEPAT